MIVKTRGVVLHYTKYSDSSGIVNVFTQQAGRQSYIVRGLNKGKKAVRNVMFQPLTILEIEGSHSSKREVQQMKSCSLGYVPVSTSFSFAKSSVSIFLAEVLNSTLHEDAPDHSLFEFLENSIIELDRTENGIANFHIMFLAKLTRFLGFGPSVPETGSEMVFDLTSGVFGQVPPASGEYATQISSNLLALFLKTPFHEMGEIKMGKEERRELLALLIKYYSIHVPGFRKINSTAILYDLFEL
jgi:DNA repair protein RecO (recombination protein O)